VTPASYGASKAGVFSLTKFAGVEYAKDGIRVNSIAPVLHKTSLGAKSGTLTAEEREQNLLKLVAQNIQMGRVAAAGELKGLAVFLASDASSFVTGSVFVQDGGQMAIHASFSHERMTYVPEESKVIYQSKDGRQERTFGALQWLAAMGAHIPNKGEQMVPHYGYYSNVSRGRRKKQNRDALIPSILEPDEDPKAYRKNWTRLIQKIYQADPIS